MKGIALIQVVVPTPVVYYPNLWLKTLLRAAFSQAFVWNLSSSVWQQHRHHNHHPLMVNGFTPKKATACLCNSKPPQQPCMMPRGVGSSSVSWNGLYHPIANDNAFGVVIRKQSFHSTSTTSVGEGGTILPVLNNDDEEQQEQNVVGITTPPIAKRDETLYVYAGVAATNTNMNANVPITTTTTTGNENEDVNEDDDVDDDDDIVPRQSSSSYEKLIDPPIAISDPYGWLRDETRSNSTVLEHLKLENSYTEYIMEKHITSSTKDDDGLIETLYQEMLSSIQQTDYTAPRPDGIYWYYTRTAEGKSYTIYCRAPKTTKELLTIITFNHPDTSTAASDGTSTTTTTATVVNITDLLPVLPNEQIMLDVNQLAEGKSYCSVGSVSISPSQKLLAYSIDYSGDETYLLYIKDLSTGQIVHHDSKLVISGPLCWGIDDTTIYYSKMDTTHRPYQVYKRSLNNSIMNTNNTNTTSSIIDLDLDDGNNNKNGDGDDDELIYEDLDDMFWIDFYKSTDEKYLFIDSSSQETTETHYVDLTSNKKNLDSSESTNATTATTTPSQLQCIAKRRSKVLYDVDHRNGYWWISSNVGRNATNSNNLNNNNNLEQVQPQPNMALYTSKALPNCENEWKLVVTSSPMQFAS